MADLTQKELEDKFLEENKYADGELVPCDCEECQLWSVGDDRCTCGNRRVYQYADTFNGEIYIIVECY